MKELSRFHQEVVEIFGAYTQVRAGIIWFHQRLVEMVDGPGDTTADNEMFFGPGDPNDPNAVSSYRKKFGELLQDSDEGGTLHVGHARSTVVLVYASWEDHYRKRIASEIGFSCKNDLTSEVFADLNSMRQAILHVRGRLDKQPRTIHIFRKGDTVALNDGHLSQIFQAIVDDLNRIGRDHYGQDPQFRLYQPMRAEPQA